MSHWVSSEIAASYRAFRPRYPETLFERIAKLYFPRSSSSSPPEKQQVQNNKPPALILDIGCGSGQAISGLFNVFPPSASTKYIGLDPSEAQLQEARKEFESTKEFVSFVQGDAGSADHDELAKKVSCSSFKNENQPQQQQVDLVTVAQALHWIDIKNFASALLKPQQEKQQQPLLNPDTGMIAAWLYSTNRVVSSKECDKILDDFDKMLLKEGYWPDGRWSIENLYKNQILEFEQNGFDFVGKEVVSDERELSLESFVQYLNTWSGVQKFEKAKKLEHGVAIEEAIRKPFLDVLMNKKKNAGDGEEKQGDWKDGPTALRVRYDFHLFVFRPKKQNLFGFRMNMMKESVFGK